MWPVFPPLSASTATAVGATAPQSQGAATATIVLSPSQLLAHQQQLAATCVATDGTSSNAASGGSVALATVPQLPHSSLLAAHAQARGGRGHPLLRSNLPPHHRARLGADTSVYDREELLRLIDLVSHEPRVAEVITTVMDAYEAYEASQKAAMAAARAVEAAVPAGGVLPAPTVHACTSEGAQKMEDSSTAGADGGSAGGAVGEGSFTQLRPRAPTNPPEDADAAPSSASSAPAKKEQQPPSLLHQIIRGHSSVDAVINVPYYTSEGIRGESSGRGGSKNGEEGADADEAVNAAHHRLNQRYDALNVGHRVAEALEKMNHTPQSPSAGGGGGAATTPSSPSSRYKRYVERAVPSAVTDSSGYVANNLYVRGGYREAVAAEAYEAERARVVAAEGRRLLASGGATRGGSISFGVSDTVSAAASGPPLRSLLLASPAGRQWHDSARAHHTALEQMHATLAATGGGGDDDDADRPQTAPIGRVGLGGASAASFGGVVTPQMALNARTGAQQPFDILPSLTDPKARARNASSDGVSTLLATTAAAAAAADPKAFFYRNPATNAPWSDCEVMRMLRREEEEEASAGGAAAAAADASSSSSAVAGRAVPSPPILRSKYDSLNPLAFVPAPPRDPAVESRAMAAQQRKLLEAFGAADIM